MSALAGPPLPLARGLRPFLQRLDVLLVLSTAALVGFGLLMVYSSTHLGPRPFLYLRSQTMHLAFGLLIGLSILAIDYRVLASSARPLYVWLAGTVGVEDVVCDLRRAVCLRLVHHHVFPDLCDGLAALRLDAQGVSAILDRQLSCLTNFDGLDVQ